LPEYGWRKLSQSVTAPPVEVRAICRKSRLVVDAFPSWYVAQPLGIPGCGDTGVGNAVVA
jgi:hypothetical protein